MRVCLAQHSTLPHVTTQRLHLTAKGPAHQAFGAMRCDAMRCVHTAQRQAKQPRTSAHTSISHVRQAVVIVNTGLYVYVCVCICVCVCVCLTLGVYVPLGPQQLPMLDLLRLMRLRRKYEPTSAQWADDMVRNSSAVIPQVRGIHTQRRTHTYTTDMARNSSAVIPQVCAMHIGSMHTCATPVCVSQRARARACVCVCSACVGVVWSGGQ